MFLIIININFISASEMDQGTDIISEEILSDGSGIDEINDGEDNEGGSSVTPTDNTENDPETPVEPETPTEPETPVESDDPIEPVTPEEPVILEKTSISSADYVIKDKFLNFK